MYSDEILDYGGIKNSFMGIIRSQKFVSNNIVRV